MPTPTTAPANPAPPRDRAVRLLAAAIRVALVSALTALVLAIAALAYIVSFEAIPAFAIETAAFPPGAGLVSAAAGRQVHHRRQPGHPLALPTRRRPARPLVRLDLVGCATAVSVA